VGEMEEPTNPRGVPPGWPTVTPRIVAIDTEPLVAFIKHVFGASGEHREASPSELRIGASVIMISGAGVRAPMPAFLYVYVPDADATYQRAVDAGARALEPPADMPYGDRRCMLEDAWGNTWQIATYRGPPPG
jgi:PhnB protein